MKYVYEFTNKRKLTRYEFIKWFQKKFLYTIKKFKMIEKNDVVAYMQKDDFRSAVLEDLLNMLSERAPVRIVKIPPKKKAGIKFTKKAVPETSDTESYKFIKEIIHKKIKHLERFYPSENKKIKPLYFFLDKEVELYAKLRKLKYKKIIEEKDKTASFIDNLEKKHPELKHSIIHAYLKIHGV